MKKIIMSGLLALIMITTFTACPFNHEPDIISYHLALSFQDTSGNDLVRGIGLEQPEWGDPIDENTPWGTVERDLYILDIVASRSCEDATGPRPGYQPALPDISMDRFNGYTFLRNDYALDVKQCPEEKIITYKLRCPYVFDNYEHHKLVTYWEVPKKNDNIYYAICTRIEFEGKVFTPIKTNQLFPSRFNIILEGREINDHK